MFVSRKDKLREHICYGKMNLPFCFFFQKHVFLALLGDQIQALKKNEMKLKRKSLVHLNSLSKQMKNR